MRVVVIGATGNVGTSVLEALASRPEVDEIVGVARRSPRARFAKTTFVTADITTTNLVPILKHAAAAIHLAWLIQPGRDESATHRVNVDGSERVFRSVAEAGVPTIVYASSVGTYSAGPKDRLVDESWATDGVQTSFYSRHKVKVERLLDRFEREYAGIRVVRLRPGLIFKAQAATEIRRLFAGPFLPRMLLRNHLVPIVPDLPRLRFQAVHSHDVGDAYAQAAINAQARGAYNIAAEPVLGPAELAQVLHARRLRIPASILRVGAAAAFHARLTPTEPGWLDMALAVPLLDTSRARRELGWTPARNAVDTLAELIDGLGHGTDFDTPPLAGATTAPARVRELATGVGARQ